MIGHYAEDLTIFKIFPHYYLWVTEELSNEEFPTVRILYKILEEDQIVVLPDIEES